MIELPDPDDAPVTFVVDAVQLKLVPDTPLGFPMAMEVGLPENSDWPDAVTVGTGFTVTKTEAVVPVQPFNVGVIT